MRFQLQALPKTVSGKADQYEPTDDDQGMQHGCWTKRIGVRFKSGGNANRAMAGVFVISKDELVACARSNDGWTSLIYSDTGPAAMSRAG